MKPNSITIIIYLINTIDCGFGVTQNEKSLMFQVRYIKSEDLKNEKYFYSD